MLLIALGAALVAFSLWCKGGARAPGHDDGRIRERVVLYERVLDKDLE